MISILVIAFLALVIIWPIMSAKREKQEERKQRSNCNTKIEDYLWIIRLLKSKGFNMTRKNGMNTSHVTLTFEGPNNVIVEIDHDYTVLDNTQGKLYLKSGDKKLRTYFFENESRVKEIEDWLCTLK